MPRVSNYEQKINPYNPPQEADRIREPHFAADSSGTMLGGQAVDAAGTLARLAAQSGNTDKSSELTQERIAQADRNGVQQTQLIGRAANAGMDLIGGLVEHEQAVKHVAYANQQLAQAAQNASQQLAGSVLANDAVNQVRKQQQDYMAALNANPLQTDITPEGKQRTLNDLSQFAQIARDGLTKQTTGTYGADSNQAIFDKAMSDAAVSNDESLNSTIGQARIAQTNKIASDTVLASNQTAQQGNISQALKDFDSPETQHNLAAAGYGAPDVYAARQGVQRSYMNSMNNNILDIERFRGKDAAGHVESTQVASSKQITDANGLLKQLATTNDPQNPLFGANPSDIAAHISQAQSTLATATNIFNQQAALTPSYVTMNAQSVIGKADALAGTPGHPQALNDAANSLAEMIRSNAALPLKPKDYGDNPAARIDPQTGIPKVYQDPGLTVRLATDYAKIKSQQVAANTAVEQGIKLKADEIKQGQANVAQARELKAANANDQYAEYFKRDEVIKANTGFAQAMADLAAVPAVTPRDTSTERETVRVGAQANAGLQESLHGGVNTAVNAHSMLGLNEHTRVDWSDSAIEGTRGILHAVGVPAQAIESFSNTARAATAVGAGINAVQQLSGNLGGVLGLNVSATARQSVSAGTTAAAGQQQRQGNLTDNQAQVYANAVESYHRLYALQGVDNPYLKDQSVSSKEALAKLGEIGAKLKTENMSDTSRALLNKEFGSLYKEAPDKTLNFLKQYAGFDKDAASHDFRERLFADYYVPWREQAGANANPTAELVKTWKDAANHDIQKDWSAATDLAKLRNDQKQLMVDNKRTGGREIGFHVPPPPNAQQTSEPGMPPPFFTPAPMIPKAPDLANAELNSRPGATSPLKAASQVVRGAANAPGEAAKAIYDKGSAAVDQGVRAAKGFIKPPPAGVPTDKQLEELRKLDGKPRGGK